MDILPSHHYDGAVLIAPKAQEGYFKRYRSDHPDESFDVLDLQELEEMFQYELLPGAEEVLKSVGDLDLETAKVIIKRLRFAPRIKALESYFVLMNDLENKGFLRVKHDPFAYFKGRMIIVRGYADGRAISEAMQDLPNICVNFDFGQERPRLEPARTVSMEDAIGLLENTPRPAYLLVPAGSTIPNALMSLPRLEKPYAPAEGSFFALRSTEPYFIPEFLHLDDETLKALRLPTPAEAERRLEVEMRALLSSSRLIAYIAWPSRQEGVGGV